VLASQTCNAQNPDIERVPTVEFIRAHLLAADKVNGSLSDGANPRLLHARAKGCGDDFQDMEFRITERIWVPRRRLMDLCPTGLRLEDSEVDVTMRAKETFAAWLARSYVRVELPNAFVELFNETKLKEFFAKIAKDHSDKIQGVYLDLRPRTDDSDARYSPTQVARFSAPYQLHVTFVVQDPDVIGAIEATFESLSAKRIPKMGSEKISRRNLAAEKGIEVTEEVVTIDGWSVRDLMGSIRFTDWDHLSGIEESAL
jgi:hypothetical protein